MMPVRNATTPVTESAVENLATSDTRRSIPCARSSSAMSTVTPHTITITRHGIRFTASTSSAAPVSTRTTAARNAPIPTFTSNSMTPKISATITPRVIQWRASKAGVSTPGPSGSASACSCLAKSFSPPNRKYPLNATAACAATLYR
jgi:hypothetical protein